MTQTATPLPPLEAKAKIAATLAVLEESWNRHDMIVYAAQFTPDADFVNVLGMLQRGRPAIEAQHVAIHKTFFRNSRIQTLDQSIRFLTPEVAVAHVTWQMTGHETPQVNEWHLPAIRKGILTAVLVSQGELWRIAALHNTDSVPVAGLGK